MLMQDKMLMRDARIITINRYDICDAIIIVKVIILKKK